MPETLRDHNLESNFSRTVDLHILSTNHSQATYCTPLDLLDQGSESLGMPGTCNKIYSLDESLLRKATQSELWFLELINRSPGLTNPGNTLKRAIYRYEKCWLPLLKSVHPASRKKLAPPLDVYWIWHCHMLSPVQYAADMMRIMEDPCDHHVFWANTAQYGRAKYTTEQRWNKLYRDSREEKFEIDCQTTRGKSPPEYESVISYNLEAAVMRQRDFYYNVSLPHYRDTNFITGAINRYKKFISMKRGNRDAFLTPTYDIDLVWHSHQLCPASYKTDMMSILGYMLNHDDTDQDRQPGSKLNTAHTDTAELFVKTYNVEYNTAGCMYRGLPPSHYIAHESERQRINLSTANFMVTFNKVQLDNFECPPGCQFKIQGYKLTRDNDPIVGVLPNVKNHITFPGTNFSWSSRSLAHFSTEKYWAVRLVLFMRKGFLCNLWEEKQAVAVLDLPLPCDSGLSVSASQTINTQSKMIPVSDVKSIFKLPKFPELSSNIEIKRIGGVRGDCLMEMEPGITSYVDCIPEEYWNGVPLPSCKLNIAGSIVKHRLLNANKMLNYNVSVVHSRDAMMSAVTLSNTHTRAIAHLIGSNQLPTPLQLSSVSGKVCIPTLDPLKGERAMLVKDAEGDYAVIVGRWEVLKNRVRQNYTTSKNPGFLFIKSYYLRNMSENPRASFQVKTCPSRRDKYDPFFFRYTLGNVTVDMCSGEIVVNKSSQVIAAEVACGFAVAMLFVLCNPWTGRPNQKTGAPPPAYSEIYSSTGQTKTVTEKITFASRKRQKSSYSLDDLCLAYALGSNDPCVPSAYYLRCTGCSCFNFTDIQDTSSGLECVTWNGLTDGDYLGSAFLGPELETNSGVSGVQTTNTTAHVSSSGHGTSGDAAGCGCSGGDGGGCGCDGGGGGCGCDGGGCGGGCGGCGGCG